MFTGIVSECGRIRRGKVRKGVLELEIEARETARGLHRGDSVSVDGVCLTAVEVSRKSFAVQAMQETIDRSALGALATGAQVNLELPLRLSDRIGGHLVQGHVDGTATLLRFEEDDASRRMWFSLDSDLLRYLVRKGSVAVNGVALTVTEVGVASFGVAVIPHTLQVTTLGRLVVGDEANIEVDMIAKYIERLTLPHEPR